MGGSQPPAQYKPSMITQVGRIRTIVQPSTIQPNTQLSNLAGASLPNRETDKRQLHPLAGSETLNRISVALNIRG